MVEFGDTFCPMLKHAYSSGGLAKTIVKAIECLDVTLLS